MNYSVKIGGESRKKSLLSNKAGGTVTVSLVDQEGQTVAISTGAEGILTVENAKLWWPFTMVQNDKDAGYLYNLVVRSIKLNQPCKKCDRDFLISF